MSDTQKSTPVEAAKKAATPAKKSTKPAKKIQKKKHIKTPQKNVISKKDRKIQSKRDKAVSRGFVIPSVKPNPPKPKTEKPKEAPKVKKAAAPKKPKAPRVQKNAEGVEVPVPEKIKKKLTAKQWRKVHSHKAKILTAKRKASTKKLIYKRAEYYAAKYKRSERALIKLRRIARNAGGFFREPEPKVALVVRIRGINGVDPRTKKILQLFRLRQIHNATFVKLNAATIKMLRLVEPYVTYGTPNLKTVRHLLYKRGCLKVHGQRIPICSNGPIAQKFKKINLICVEDLIHQIFTCGKHFKKVNKSLWPFKLNSPKGGYKQKTIHFQEGGDAGNREDKINAFVQRMI